QTHVSLFDGSNCGIALTDRPAFSVQYHPEASPGPRDSHYLFDRFIALIEDEKSKSENSEASGQAPLRKAGVA
ncbi:MAG: glutamine amidotransferase-related protein, partial [Microvirga sp.]